jgi:AraC-like DNA-binding protein
MFHLRLRQFLAPGDICHAAISSVLDPDPPPIHGHDFMEVFLVVEGAGWHLINGQRLALKKGDLVFIRQPDCHGFTPREGENLRVLNVAFPCSWFARFRMLLPRPATVSRWLRSTLPPTLHLPAGARESLEQRGLDLMLDQSPRHVGLAQFCLEAFGFLEDRPRSEKETAPPEWLARCVDGMAQPENLLKELAWFQRRAGRSPEHFARICRRCFGVPPTELLNRARIRHARRRLLESDAKVIDVGYDCGFHNLAYFHRTFLRLAGCTPRRWRLKNPALMVPR